MYAYAYIYCIYTHLHLFTYLQWSDKSRPAFDHPLCRSLYHSVSLSLIHTHKTALFLSTNHLDPIHSHQLALRRATACDSHSPWQPTYVQGRKWRLALKSCLCVGSNCPSAEHYQAPIMKSDHTIS